MMKLILNNFNNIKEFEIKDYKKIKENNTIFHIPREIINLIIKQRNENLEKGGFLIGYKIKNVSQYTVSAISLPIKNDTSDLVHFHLSWTHNRYVKKYLKNHKRNLIVIGLWHTHPGTLINPSGNDLQYFRKLAKKSNQRFSLNTITTTNKTHYIVYDNFKRMIKSGIVN